jgi:phosphatidylserine/phosphatidylglycerophosphate/cardiolipin synthase-like enzyme
MAAPKARTRPSPPSRSSRARLWCALAVAALVSLPLTAAAGQPAPGVPRPPTSAVQLAQQPAALPAPHLEREAFHPAFAGGSRPAAAAVPVRVIPAASLRSTNVSAAASRTFAEVTKAASHFPATVSNVETDGNRVLRWPLVNNAEIGQAMHDLIASAHKEVFIETMILKDSVVAAKVRDAVQELARTRPDVPVYVRFTPSPFEIPSVAKRAAEKFLDSPNVIVGVWNSRTVGGRWSLHRLLGLNVSHSKSVVVDNRVALITDTNLQRESDAPTGWFQNGIVVEGPIAATIREQSAAAWRVAAPTLKLPAPPPPHPGFSNGLRMLTLGQNAAGGADTSANQAYIAAFKNAERRVCILTPNLNDRDTMAALAEATRQADVYIILPKGFGEMAESMPGQGGGNAENVSRLAQMAADPTRLHVRWNPDPAGQPTEGKGEWSSHAKTILVDDIVFVGSKNLDTQSAKVSRELSIAIPDRATASRFHELFENRWQKAPLAFEADPSRTNTEVVR